MPQSQAITTTFLAPTNTKGARIRARSNTEYLETGYDHAMSDMENHVAGAMALARKLEIDCEWCGGATTFGYAFACRNSSIRYWSAWNSRNGN